MVTRQDISQTCVIWHEGTGQVHHKVNEQAASGIIRLNRVSVFQTQDKHTKSGAFFSKRDMHWKSRTLVTLRICHCCHAPPLLTPLFPQVDFSRNAIRRLNVDVLEGLEPHLLELHLDHNLLGNNYNPSFSFTEVAKLTALQVRTWGLCREGKIGCLRMNVDTLATIVIYRNTVYLVV